jgi:hypothetical protein
MKKVLSIALAVIMLFSVIPFVGIAADVTWDQDLNDPVTIEAGQTAIVNGNIRLNSNAHITVAQGGRILINPNCSIDCYKGLINNYGTIENKGTIHKKESISDMGGQGTLKHWVEVPNPADGAKYHLLTNISGEVNIIDGFDLDWATYNAEAPETEYYSEEPVSAYFDDGSQIFFTLIFDEAKVDPYKFQVMAGGNVIDRDSGVYRIVVGNAVTVSYGSYNEAQLIKQIKINLPSGEGYRCVAYGTSTEQAVQDAIDTVYIDYGTNLRFRVAVFEGWQESQLTVTVGGIEQEPDSYGYYLIENVTDIGEKAKAYEIVVKGVVSDEMQNILKSVFNFIQQIFQTFKEIFQSFAELFGGFNIFGNDTTPPEETTAAP